MLEKELKKAEIDHNNEIIKELLKKLNEVIQKEAKVQ